MSPEDCSTPPDKPNKKRSRMDSLGEVVAKKTKKADDFGFEYLDHPADIQLHSWGRHMERAMEQLLVSMYAYLIDDKELKAVDEVYEYYFEASGHDMESLIFSFLNVALVDFQSEPLFIGKRVIIDSLDLKKFVVKYHALGDSYDIKKHGQGTDVKAITYSNMQILHKEDRSDLYVIIDI